MSLWPCQYSVYKGLKGKYGAVRFSYKKPSLESGNKYTTEGVVFIESCKTVAPNKYDWENGNKITFAAKVLDAAKIVNFLENQNNYDCRDFEEITNESGVIGLKLSIFHDPGAGKGSKNQTKKYFELAKLNTQDSVWLKMTQIKDGESYVVSLPLSQSEALALRELMRAAISGMLAWS